MARRYVDIRKAYDLGGYKGDYSWFIRNKVIPIIGERSLHEKPSRRGSRIKEWKCTERNFRRILKSLGLDERAHKRALSRRASKVVQGLGADKTGELIIELMSRIPKAVTNENEVEYRVPAHPFSNNYMYEYNSRSRGGVRCTDAYARHKVEVDALLGAQITVEDSQKVDFSKPMHVDLHFAHRPNFDSSNFIKAAIDNLARCHGFNDRLVQSSSYTSEHVGGFVDGWYSIRVRNI